MYLPTCLVAGAIQDVATEGLANEIPNLDARELETIIKSIESFEHTREPAEAILSRDRAWSAVAFDWWGRLWVWKDNLVGTTAETYRAALTRSDMPRRLTTAEAAVRRYIIQLGSPPESLESLVPVYLSTVPQDPYSGEPLVYRRTPDGYLLYSVGPNRTDDGGQRVSFNQAISKRVGNVFFDTRCETP